jgi:hypothetical protein
LAHSLGRIVVAEGVETRQQAAFLARNRYDELQGYLFSRPVAADDVSALLQGTRTPCTDTPPLDQPTFPPLLASILEPGRPLTDLVPTLLRELTTISGLQSAFVTEVRQLSGEQITHFSSNAHPTAMRIEEGLTVNWGDALCRRMVEDQILCATDVGTRYRDVEVAATLEIETYVSIPVHDSTGVIRGTLCAASSEAIAVDEAVIGLLQLFGRALGERIPELGGGREPQRWPEMLESGSTAAARLPVARPGAS